MYHTFDDVDGRIFLDKSTDLVNYTNHTRITKNSQITS